MENQVNIQEVEINSTCKAIVISPKLTGKMALVDFKTLQKITSMLSYSSFAQIKEEFIIAVKQSENLEQYNSILKEEVCFHESVNLINTYEIKEEQKFPG